VLKQHESVINANTIHTEEIRVSKLGANSECIIGFDTRDNSPFVSLYHNGRCALMLGVSSKTEDPRMTFFDHDEQPRMTLRLVNGTREDPSSPGGRVRTASSQITLWNPKDELRLFVALRSNGDPEIGLNDRVGRRIAALEISPEGKPFLAITDPATGKGVRAGISPTGPDVTITDGDVPTHRFPSKEN
jgi:hypothetical protein